MTGTLIWLNYNQETLDQQYDQRSIVPDGDAWKAADGEKSAEVRAAMECRLDMAYGATPEERLDLFPATAPGSPILIYFHGGAWTRGSKSNESFIAEPLVNASAAVVMVEFTLAPAASLDTIIDQSRRAVAWVHAHADEINGDADHMVVAGHSSGAHQTAMMLVTDWAGTAGLPADVIKGGVMTSGMYELTPVRLSYRNGYLNLDEAAVDRNSPIRHLRPDLPPMAVFYGEGELNEFRRQGRDFVDALLNAGLGVQSADLPGLNHFQMGRELGNPDGPVHKAALGFLGLAD